MLLVASSATKFNSSVRELRSSKTVHTIPLAGRLAEVCRLLHIADMKSDPHTEDLIVLLREHEVGRAERKGETPLIVTLAKIRAVASEIDRRRALTAARFNMEQRDLFALFLLQRVHTNDSLRAADLKDAMGISSGAMSKCVDRLERAKLVQRVDDVDDRRVWRLQITEHGLSVADQARHDPAWDIIERLYAVLDAEEWAMLETLISKLWVTL